MPDINHDGTVFPAGAVALHVGAAGEPAVLRFTAPGDGEYRIQSRFQGIAGPPAERPHHDRSRCGAGPRTNRVLGPDQL